MTEEKKQETKKEEVKLPQLHYVVLGNCYIHTKKGMCMWMSPTNVTLEENIENLQYTISVFEAQIEANKKKQEEEEKKNKPPSENKKGEFKQV